MSIERDGGKIATGILGAGGANIATASHVPGTMTAKNLRLAALGDLNPAVGEYAAKYGVKAYGSLDEMLQCQEIEMIQVATPDWLHFQQAEKVLAAGKHVLLQKPPCLTLEELVKLEAAMHKSKGRLKIALNQRETKLSRTIKKVIDSGDIGELREIIIRYRGRRFPIQNLNSPYLKKETGGVFIHNGMHWLDEAFFYSGRVPESVCVFSTRNPLGSPQVLGESPNYWSAIFGMGPTTFLFEYNAALTADGMPGGMQRELIGTKGEIRHDYGGELTLHLTGEATPRHVELEDPEVDVKDDAVNSFRLLLEKFAAEILDDNEREPRISDSLCLFEALLRGATESELGKTIALRRKS